MQNTTLILVTTVGTTAHHRHHCIPSMNICDNIYGIRARQTMGLMAAECKSVSSVAVENAVSGNRICQCDVTADTTVGVLQEAVLCSLQDSGSAQDLSKILLLHKGKFLTDGRQTLHQAGLQDTACVVQALQCQRSLMAAACDDKHVALIDVETHSAIRSFMAHSEPVLCVAFAPAGRFLASGSQDCTVRIWEVSENMACVKVLQGHQDAVAAVAFTPDGGRLLTASWDDDAKLWCWESGECVLTLSGHAMSVNSVSPSSDGRLIVTSSNDETARVWCSESGNCLLVLTGHHHFVVSGKFSHDSCMVLTASLDRTAKAWDVTDGHCCVTFAGHSSFVQFAEYSWDGNLVVTASEDESAKVWKLNGECLFTLSGDSRKACLIRATFGPQDQIVVLAAMGVTSTSGRLERIHACFSPLHFGTDA